MLTMIWLIFIKGYTVINPMQHIYYFRWYELQIVCLQRIKVCGPRTINPSTLEDVDIILKEGMFKLWRNGVLGICSEITETPTL